MHLGGRARFCSDRAKVRQRVGRGYHAPVTDGLLELRPHTRLIQVMVLGAQVEPAHLDSARGAHVQPVMAVLVPATYAQLLHQRTFYQGRRTRPSTVSRGARTAPRPGSTGRPTRYRSSPALIRPPRTGGPCSWYRDVSATRKATGNQPRSRVPSPWSVSMWPIRIGGRGAAGSRCRSAYPRAAASSQCSQPASRAVGRWEATPRASRPPPAPRPPRRAPTPATRSSGASAAPSPKPSGCCWRDS